MDFILTLLIKSNCVCLFFYYYSYKYAIRQFELKLKERKLTLSERHTVAKLSLANAHVYVVFTILIAAPTLTAPHYTHVVVNKYITHSTAATPNSMRTTAHFMNFIHMENVLLISRNCKTRNS